MTRKQELEASIVTEALRPGEQWIAMAEIHESEENGRIHYPEADLRELVQSIQGVGLQEALRVRPQPEGGYELVDGHRRYRALQQLERAQARCHVDAMSVEDARLYRVVTMFHKNTGTLYEQARYLAMALKNPGMNRQKLAQLTGIKPGTLKNRLELLEFPESIAQRVGQNGFSVDHARILASLAPVPAALEEGLRVAAEKEKAGELRSAPNFFQDLKKALLKADLARDPSAGKYWEVAREFPTFEGQAAKLQNLTYKAPGRGNEVLVLDVAGFDDLVAKGKAAVARRREKEAKREPTKEDIAEAKRRAREDRQRALDHAAGEWMRDAMRAAALERVRTLEAVDGQDVFLLAWNTLEVGVRDVEALAVAANVKADDLRALLEWNSDVDPASLAILQGSPAALLRVLLAVQLEDLTNGHYAGWRTVCQRWTGKTPDEWKKEAMVEARKLLKAKAQTDPSEESADS